MITVKVNGQSQSFSLQTSLVKMLEQLGLNPRLVAIEYNGAILPREYWESTYLKTDDCLEIVTIVGGG